MPPSPMITLLFPSKELLLGFLGEVFTHEFEISAKWLSVTAAFPEKEIELARQKYQAFLTEDNLRANR
jgi:hypothetical protein